MDQPTATPDDAGDVATDFTAEEEGLIRSYVSILQNYDMGAIKSRIGDTPVIVIGRPDDNGFTPLAVLVTSDVMDIIHRPEWAEETKEADDG